MLQENLKALRRAKGMSQEVLAQQLHVVRQTVSKWEKGLSVPDADLLVRIAELFEVSVGDLLGSEVETAENRDEVAVQLAILNEQLANRHRRHKRLLIGLLAGLAAVAILWVAVMVVNFAAVSAQVESGMTTTAELNCTLDGAEYSYSVTYDEQYRIIEAGGDEWIADHVQTERYDDANILIAQIEDYFNDRGGSVELN